jgi:N-acetyl-gamma-glutamyl-phosphate reductase
MVRVAIVGASGYAGAELLRLLIAHPEVDIAAVYARSSAGARLADVFPQFRGVIDLAIEPFDPAAVADAAQVAFTALPHGDSARAVGELVRRGVTVIDLSADFRLRSAEVYAQWYGDSIAGPHPEPQLLSEAVYGLPELHRAAIRGARLVAAPGCYPTSAILPAAPLLARQLISPSGLVIDAKSGASGAGRSPGLATHLPEAGEGVRAYKVAGAHRHTAEIEQELAAVAGGAVRLTFSPHLLPMSRGILACVYGDPTDPGRPEAAYRDALAEAYAGERFVTVLPADALPDTSFVRGSNRAHLAVRLDQRAGKVIAMCAIDNLAKGASGQAIQCLNIMRGWDEATALSGIAVFP